MNDRINPIQSTDKTQYSEGILIHWKEYQLTGEHLANSQMVLDGLIGQIEYYYSSDRIKEARACLDTIPDSINLNQPLIREKLTDTYVMVDDVNYFYTWYQDNLAHQTANAGDQILIYALLSYNRNTDAKWVFDKIFPALTSATHFKYALKHIPKLIETPSQREPYYRSILKKSQNALLDSDNEIDEIAFYEISLQTHYCLNETSEFEKITLALAQTYPEAAQQHLLFLERLLDRDNPKWKENKVFGIGLSKTGTVSLSKAFGLLHFSTAHWTNPYSHDLLAQNDIPLFDSLTDISITYQFKEIYEHYPAAKFILTSRPIEKWEKSFLTHYARSVHATSLQNLKEIITNQYPSRFGQRYVDMHQKLYFQSPNLSEAYCAHEQDVFKFFQGRERQLLSLDVSQPNSLQRLSEFLGVDCPQSDFPYENTKEEKSKWVSPISGETRTFKFRA